MSLNSRLKNEDIIDGILFKIHPDKMFAASKCGKVLGRTGRILKLKSQGKYLIVSYQVKIDNKNKIRHKYVHRLVAEVWLPNPNNFEEVNHINGDKLNNESSNLEWVSHEQNIKHAIINGLCWNLPTKGQRGFRKNND